jgi:RND superfamily putative drug exporter
MRAAFGLAMDFEVFLVSQIKEHADAGEDPKRSVVSGLLTSGRVITAAATIMVFGSFVLNGDRTVKPFGIGLAVAVILDATVVGCLLVPARTASLGKANWYLPRWLGKILPRISIECEKYFKARDRIPAATQLQAPQVPAARS